MNLIKDKNGPELKLLLNFWLISKTQRRFKMAANGNGSPASGSGSPGSGAAKMKKADAKKILKAEVAELVNGIKLLPTYVEKLGPVPRGQKLPVNVVDPTTRQLITYQIGAKELKEFQKHIISGLNDLPDRAFSLSKVRRPNAPGSGFQAPARFSQELVNFFANAELGPVVNGSFMMKENVKKKESVRVANPATLVPVPGSRLNSKLYFTQPQINGQQNPLYTVISPGTVTPLFALHSHYVNPQMQKESDPTRLSASAAMRQGLRNIIAATIQADAGKFSKDFPQYAPQIATTAQQLIASIDNPSAVVNSAIPNSNKEMFNPNNFRFADFSKLISTAKDKSMKADQFATVLAGLRPQIAQVYQSVPEVAARMAEINRLTPPGQSAPYEQAVLSDQHDSSTLARSKKNKEKDVITKARKKQQAAAKKQAAQAQAGLLPQAQPLLGR